MNLKTTSKLVIFILLMVPVFSTEKFSCCCNKKTETKLLVKPRIACCCSNNQDKDLNDREKIQDDQNDSLHSLKLKLKECQEDILQLETSNSKILGDKKQIEKDFQTVNARIENQTEEILKLKASNSKIFGEKKKIEKDLEESKTEQQALGERLMELKDSNLKEKKKAEEKLFRGFQDLTVKFENQSKEISKLETSKSKILGEKDQIEKAFQEFKDSLNSPVIQDESSMEQSDMMDQKRDERDQNFNEKKKAENFYALPKKQKSRVGKAVIGVLGLSLLGVAYGATTVYSPINALNSIVCPSQPQEQSMWEWYKQHPKSQFGDQSMWNWFKQHPLSKFGDQSPNNDFLMKYKSIACENDTDECFQKYLMNEEKYGALTKFEKRKEFFKCCYSTPKDLISNLQTSNARLSKEKSKIERDKAKLSKEKDEMERDFTCLNAENLTEYCMNNVKIHEIKIKLLSRIFMAIYTILCQLIQGFINYFFSSPILAK